MTQIYVGGNKGPCKDPVLDSTPESLALSSALPARAAFAGGEPDFWSVPPPAAGVFPAAKNAAGAPARSSLFIIAYAVKGFGQKVFY